MSQTVCKLPHSALIYTIHITSGPCCTRGSRELSYRALNAALLRFCCCWACFSWMLSISSLCYSIFLLVSLASCPFIFFVLSHSYSFPFPQFAVSVCVPEFTLCSLLKEVFFSHLNPSAKSSHPSGTHCSSELCQPSPVRFMNHFLLNFSLTDMCSVYTRSPGFTVAAQPISWGY